MLKLTIITIGKVKETWLQTALAEYTKRLKVAIEIHWKLAKDEKQFEEWLSIEPDYIALDPRGELCSSEALSRFLFQEWEKQGSRLTFAIGGHSGFNGQMRQKARKLLSLSSLTFTHQLTRLILLEQLYRALEIRRGSPYHK